MIDTFDPSKVPYDLDPVLVKTANTAVQRLRTRLVPTITLPEAETGYRLSNKIRSFIQVHIRRCLTFVEAGLAEYKSGRSLITDQCSRAIYENVAFFSDFSSKLLPLMKSADHKAIEDLLITRAFATRVEAWIKEHGETYKSVNIITLIDRFAKRNEHCGKAFERLCDIVHPNGLGSAVYFSTIDGDIANFSDHGNDPWPAPGFVDTLLS
jgi:hypothetical protein